MGNGTSLGNYEKKIQQVQEFLGNKKAVRKLWKHIDYNDNGYVSLAEINKLVVDQNASGKGLLKDVNKAPVLMRAYKASCIGGKKNQWVERKEFPYLLRNLVFFNELWGLFDSIDAGVHKMKYVINVICDLLFLLHVCNEYL